MLPSGSAYGGLDASDDDADADDDDASLDAESAECGEQLDTSNQEEETPDQIAHRLFGDEADTPLQRCLQVEIWKPQAQTALRNLYLRVAERARHIQELELVREMDAHADEDESLFCKRVGQMLEAGCQKEELHGLLQPTDAPPEYTKVFKAWVDVAWLRHLSDARPPSGNGLQPPGRGHRRGCFVIPRGEGTVEMTAPRIGVQLAKRRKVDPKHGETTEPEPGVSGMHCGQESGTLVDPCGLVPGSLPDASLLPAPSTPSTRPPFTACWSSLAGPELARRPSCRPFWRCSTALVPRSPWLLRPAAPPSD